MVKVLFLLSAVATTVLLGTVQAVDRTKIKAELTKGDIIPKVFDNFAPSADLKIIYENNIEVENGKLLKLDVLMKAPKISFSTPNAKSKFAFIVVNLDSSAPNSTLQWLKTDINAGNPEGVDITAYSQPMQLAEAASPQRLLYALFEQQPNQNVTTANTINDTDITTNLRQFVTANNLTLLNAAYIYYTQNQTDNNDEAAVVSSRLERITNVFKEDGLLSDVLDTVNGLLGDVEDILGIHLGSGGKRGGNRNDDDDGGLLDIHIGGGGKDGGIHIGLGEEDHNVEQAAEEEVSSLSRSQKGSRASRARLNEVKESMSYSMSQEDFVQESSFFL